MLQLESLPTELLLHILLYLPVQTLSALRQTSRFWNNFFVVNESSIYHKAALLHDFVTTVDVSLHDAKDIHKGFSMNDVVTWKDYCRKCLRLHLNWLGLGHTTMSAYGRTTDSAHRFKVDETAGIIIITTAVGELRVSDLHTDKALWSLANGYVRPYAHCEYDNGYLIFDRYDGHKEVWRLCASTNSTDPVILEGAQPDDAQFRASERAASRHAATYPHGHFTPWALLKPPEPATAYHFVYPTLVVAGLHSAFLWDIPSARLIETIRDVQGLYDGDEPLGQINYVELNERHVFICGWNELRVFARGGGALVLRVPSKQNPLANTRIVLDKTAGDPRQEPSAVQPVHAHIVHELFPTPFDQMFEAVHVSPSGRELVAMLSNSRLLFIQDFQRVVKGEIAFQDAVLELEITRLLPQTGSILVRDAVSVYLALDHGRVGIVTSNGVFVITLDFTRHAFPGLRSESIPSKLGTIHDRSDMPPSASFPNMALSVVPHVGFYAFGINEAGLRDVSCLQMTESRLYMTWYDLGLPQVHEDRQKEDSKAAMMTTAQTEDTPADDSAVAPDAPGWGLPPGPGGASSEDGVGESSGWGDPAPSDAPAAGSSSLNISDINEPSGWGEVSAPGGSAEWNSHTEGEDPAGEFSGWGDADIVDNMEAAMAPATVGGIGDDDDWEYEAEDEDMEDEWEWDQTDDDYDSDDEEPDGPSLRKIVVRVDCSPR